jgi:NTP pyrophosphatase (non-canonical NTP hydrolase)
MFEKVYPSSERNIEHAGIHLAEETGELSEAVLAYRGNHDDVDFESVKLEAADLLSCFMGVFNSLEVSVAKELSILFVENCHVCKKAPCECNFYEVVKYKS